MTPLKAIVTRMTKTTTTTRTARMTRVSKLWDLIETWGFREDIKEVKGISNRDLKYPIMET